MARGRPEHPAGVHGGTAALLAVARPLRRGRARAEHRWSLLAASRTQGAQEHAKQGKRGRVSARRSTPTRSGELRRAIAVTDSFHLGRACAGAYRGEGEHGGGLGAENGPLTRPAASDRASADNGATRAAAAAVLVSGGEEGVGRGQNRGGLGAPGGVSTGLS